jgi:phosphotransferase system HPr-like phosphotransfer protein
MIQTRIVIPAKAGIHASPPRSLADTLETCTTMAPGFRRDDKQ